MARPTKQIFKLGSNLVVIVIERWDVGGWVVRIGSEDRSVLETVEMPFRSAIDAGKAAMLLIDVLASKKFSVDPSEFTHEAKRRIAEHVLLWAAAD